MSSKREKIIRPKAMKDRAMRPLAEQAIAEGWTISLRSNGHLRWRSPKGQSVFSASTPSDPRATKNLTSTLRRYGLGV